MASRSHSLSDHGTFHLALIVFVCVVMALLSGGAPTRLAGTDGLTRQIDDRVEQIEALNHIAVPIVKRGLRRAGGVHDQVVELSESTDEDDTDHYLLEDPRLDVALFESQTGLHKSSADRALTPFLLRALSSRGSPLA